MNPGSAAAAGPAPGTPEAKTGTARTRPVSRRPGHRHGPLHGGCAVPCGLSRLHARRHARHHAQRRARTHDVPRYADVQTREMSALFAALRPGLVVRYRLLGNTVRRCGRNSTAGQIEAGHPLRGEDADAWWAERVTAAALNLHTVVSDTTGPLSTWHLPDQTKNREPRTRERRTPAEGRQGTGTPAGHPLRGNRRRSKRRGTAPRAARRHRSQQVLRLRAA